METVLSAHLHVVNGSREIVEYPEFRGMTFSTPKQKEKFKRERVEEIFGCMLNEIPSSKKADFILETVELPEGIDELPNSWKPEPIIYPPKKVAEQPISFDFINVEEYNWRKPRMKSVAL